MRIAIIDCGTNTFNLLIAEKIGDQIEFIFEDKIPVKIGKGGIENRTIVPEAYQRAIDAMKSYALVIKKHDVEKVIATSTSAFRSTDNGPELIKDILNQTGIKVEIISGDKEADYIYKGVTWACPPIQGEIYLIMDIGGGSTEFILYNSQKIFFKESYLLGASRILEKFKPDDPLSSKNVKELYEYFDEVLSKELIAACKTIQPNILVGSSGFFDTLRKICFYEFKWENIIQLNDMNRGRAEEKSFSKRFLEGASLCKSLISTYKKNNSSNNCNISIEEFNHWYKKMLPMNIEQRTNIEGMTNFRAEMMGVSMLLVDYIIRKSGVEKIVNTSYSLKEGVLREVVE